MKSATELEHSNTRGPRLNSRSSHCAQRPDSFGLLAATLCHLQVGARKKPKPWAMPKTIDQVCAKLQAVGYNPLKVKPEEFVDKMPEINRRLDAAGKPVIGDAVVEIARRLLLTESYTTA